MKQPIPHEIQRELLAAAKGVDDARDRLELAVIAAWRAGASLRDIGVYAGITHTSVSNILKRRGVREKLPPGPGFIHPGG